MIIVVGGQKGGTGKTTIATNIAVMRAREGRNVHLYDIDDHQTSSLWASLRDQDINLPVISSSQGVQDGIAIKNDLITLRSEYQDIVVDVGGGNNEALRAALLLADIVIFPVVPSGIDVWTFRVLNNLVAGARNCNKNFKVRILLNRINTNPARAKKTIIKYDCFLSNFDNLTRLDSFLSQRAAVEDSTLEGTTIVEYKPDDPKAIEEIKSIYKEVFSTILEHRSNRTSGNAAVGFIKKDQQRNDYRKGRESTTSLQLRLPTSLYQELREIAFKTEDKMTPIIIRATKEYIKTLEK